MGAQGYIGRAPGDSSVIVARQTFTPTGITTNFTFASGYTVGYVDAYLNGARLIEGDDYTATDGSVVGLTTHAISGDVLELVAYKAFNVSNVTGTLGDFSVPDKIVHTNDLDTAIRFPQGDTFTVETAGSEVLRVDANSNVGIGTTNTLAVADPKNQSVLNVGVVTANSITAAAGTFGTLNVTGALTYADVTNVDAVGYATFRSGINVQGAGSTTTTLNVSGVTTMTGDANFSGNVSIAHSIFHTGDSNTHFGFPANDTFTVYTSGSERLEVDSTGTFTLDGDFAYFASSSGSNASLTLKKSDSGADSIDYLQLRNNSNDLKLKISGDGIIFTSDILASHEGDTDTLLRFPTANAFTVETGNAERLRVHTTGNVGIHSTIPGEKFTVQNGNIRLASNEETQQFVTFQQYGTGGRQYTITNAGGSNVHGQAAGDFYLRDSTGATNRVVVNASGLVGIGVTNPGEILDVNGTIRLQGSGSTTYATELYSRQDSTHVTVLESYINSGTAFEMVGSYADSGGSNPRIALCSGGQRVGVNSTAPRSILDVSGDLTLTSSSNDPSIIFDEHSGGTDPKAKIQMDQTNTTNASLRFFTEGSGTLSERIRIDSGGRVTAFNGGSNQASEFNAGANQFVITNNDNCGLTIDSTSSTSGSIHFADGPTGNESYRGIIEYDHSIDEMKFFTSALERFRITNDGLEITGTEGVSASLYLIADEGDDNGDGWRINSNQDANDMTLANNTSGSYVDKLTLTTGGDLTASGNVTAYSDISLKENIETIPNALDKVLNLRGVEFDRTDTPEKQHQIGVIAQEVEEVIPEVVLEDKHGIKSVAYGNLVGLLIESIKELKAEVNDLRAQLEG